MSQTIIHVLHPEAVRALADSRAYERGERYFREGRVVGMRRQGTALHAEVDGSQRYQVKIWARGNGLAYTCTCPMGSSEGMFCKHCVAVALAWVAQQTAEHSESSSEPETTKESASESPSTTALVAAPASGTLSKIPASPVSPALARAARALVIKPPEPMPPTGRMLFLAGTIEKSPAEPWQERAAHSLRDIEDLLILDPRRDHWDDSWEESSDHPEFRAQVEWQLTGMERADVVAMYFAPHSKSPITLLELGLCARSGKLVVLCPSGFWRKSNVDILCRRHGIHQVRDFDEFSVALRTRLAAVRV